MSTKRYYWLKLKEDFFEDDSIAWLEEQEGGKEYCLFYLKLCLKALKLDGKLIRQVGNVLIPYDISYLSKITNTKNDTVIVAMELLKKIGLIEILERGEIYLTQLHSMVGSETNKAESMRRLREARKEGVTLLPEGGNIVTKSIEYRDRDERIERTRACANNTRQSSCQDVNSVDNMEVAVDNVEVALFETFWKSYPETIVSGNKLQALDAYRRVCCLGVKETDILEAVKKYSRKCRMNQIEKKYIKMPKNFLSDLTFLEYIPLVDPTCKLCNGEGFISNKNSNTMSYCSCRDRYKTMKEVIQNEK